MMFTQERGKVHICTFNTDLYSGNHLICHGFIHYRSCYDNTIIIYHKYTMCIYMQYKCIYMIYVYSSSVYY